MDLEDLYRILRTGHVQAQGIVDTVPDPMLVLDSALTVQSANRAFFRTFGVERYDTIGQHLYDLGNGQWDIPELRHLLAEVIPKSSAVIDYKVTHEFPHIGRKVMLLTARTVFNPDNVSHLMLLSIVDITDRSRKEAEFEAVFGELRHRLKNLLGLVRALANQTKTEGVSAEEYRSAFLGRLQAVVDANDLAFSDHGEDGLEALVARATKPFKTAPETIIIEPGPSVTLASKEITSLSLLLHELATNAVKYGVVSSGWDGSNSMGGRAGRSSIAAPVLARERGPACTQAHLDRVRNPAHSIRNRLQSRWQGGTELSNRRFRSRDSRPTRKGRSPRLMAGAKDHPDRRR
ncbi:MULTISPECIES: HWE histidine kinase domain-containing protein [unclassified Mesorhizobium]|uniref:HWE histidine kinase domain-containing protein n=1 Tax=unclassified Mesorhizobium TaxID=325217 RepID=UPI0026A43F43